ncbi:MAG: hypothetical protein LPK85_09590, partial [Gammaproteobacteria bacterium]|nr:hypothetical protein [Gammaproteobacteria bacterium]
MLENSERAVSESRANPFLPAPYRVLRNKRNTHDVFTLDVEPADGGNFPHFLPGQFNMLYI